MKNKVLVNGNMVTKSWRRVVGKFAFFTLVIMPLVLLLIPAGAIWLLSLGHLNFIGVLNEYLIKISP